MTTILTHKQWEEIADRGTRGDMVWDILASWRQDHDVLVAERDVLQEKLARAMEAIDYAIKRMRALYEVRKLNDYLEDIDSIGKVQEK